MSELNIPTIGDSCGMQDVTNLLLANNFNVNVLRPFVDPATKACYVNAANGNGLRVNDATLLKDEWVYLDRAVTKVARDRMAFVADLEKMGLTMGLPNALGNTVMQYQNMSDINDAQISMDGIVNGINDRPVFDLTSLPLPLIVKGFQFTARELAASRNGNAPLDTSTAEMATRKVMELVEKLATGTYGTYAFGGGTIYGLRNFPNRVIGTYSDWSASGKTGEEKLADIITMMEAARGVKRYGPYGVYLASNLARYLDEDYKAESSLTLRQRILALGQDGGAADSGSIRFVKCLDYLTDNDIIVVQMTSDVIQEIVGIRPTLVQWKSGDGMLLNFKVMALMVPRIRADYNNSCGIVHYTKAP